MRRSLALAPWVLVGSIGCKAPPPTEAKWGMPPAEATASPVTGIIETMASAANAWIDAADREQRRKAVYRFDHRERKGFRVIPVRLDGVELREMSLAQRSWVRTILSTGLSEAGFNKVDDIMELEPLVVQRADTPLLRAVTRLRDPGRYYFTVYGQPSATSPWGLRFDGHHVSLSWTAGPDEQLSVTPFFLGSEPRQIPQGQPQAGHRVLGEEEDAGRALWEALRPEQRAKATLELDLAHGAFYQHRPMFVGDAKDMKTVEAVGLARAEMDEAQVKLLDAIIETYVGNFPPPIAEQRREVIDAGGRDAIRFAWGGSAEPGKPNYYRVQGPTFVIEFDNTVPEADHVHSMYRELNGDFGDDMLADHYRWLHGER